MMDKDELLDWLVWAIIIITIILFILRIFGNSPTIDQLAVGALVGFLLKLYTKVDRMDKKLFELTFKFEELRNHKH